MKFRICLNFVKLINTLISVLCYKIYRWNISLLYKKVLSYNKYITT